MDRILYSAVSKCRLMVNLEVQWSSRQWMSCVCLPWAPTRPAIVRACGIPQSYSKSIISRQNQKEAEEGRVATTTLRWSLSSCLRVTASITEHSSKCVSQQLIFVKPSPLSRHLLGLGNALHVHLVGAIAGNNLSPSPRDSRGETAKGLAEREGYLAPKVPLNPNRRLPIPVIL